MVGIVVGFRGWGWRLIDVIVAVIVMVVRLRGNLIDDGGVTAGGGEKRGREEERGKGLDSGHRSGLLKCVATQQVRCGF